MLGFGLRFGGAKPRLLVAGVVACAVTGVMLCSVTGAALADPGAPVPPGCTAADLAGVSAGVAAQTSAYLWTHPDVNDFFTGFRGQQRDEIQDDLKTYMDANPQVHADLEQIRQPLTDLRERCGLG